MTSGAQTTKHRSRLACKRCRQSKVRCGMETAPCARCSRKGLQCEWDPGYKRTGNADRFSALERQMDTLQHAGRAHLSPAPSETIAAEQGTDGSATIPTPRELPTATLPSEDPESTYHALDIVVTESTARDLIANFFTKYAIHVPFVAQRGEPKQYHNKCPFLSWTIISIGARDMQPTKGFLSRLSPFLTSSINQVLSEAFLCQPDLGHVQALLLMALWPPVNSSFWGDRCFSVAHLAVITAMKIGLHNPGFEQEYNSRQMLLHDSDRAERVQTWAACLAVAQDSSMISGILVALPFENWKIDELLQSPMTTFELSDNLHHYLLIQRAGYDAFSRLPSRGSRNYSESDLLLEIDRAENSMLRLADQTKAIKMSLLNRLRMLSLILHIQSMHFQIDARSDTSGILRAYGTAIQLLTLAVEGGERDKSMSYSPRSTVKLLFHAVCVVFTVQHSSCHRGIDSALGKVLSIAVQICFKEQAVQWENGKDLPDRCIEVCRGLWKMSENNTAMLAADPELAVKSRLGASIVYHCLAIFFNRLQHFRQLERPTAQTQYSNESDMLLDFPALEEGFYIPDSIADLFSGDTFDTYDAL